MSKITVWFVKMSLIYLVIGVTVGWLILLFPGWAGVYFPIHAHINLLGFVSMMIFGIGYHVFPRFSGRPLYSEKLATAHFWLANVGLPGMVYFWSKYRHGGGEWAREVTWGFSALFAIGAYLFAYNVFRTLKPIEVRR